MPKSPNHGIAIRRPPTVLFWMLPGACSLACFASRGLRLTRYGAKAPGQMASSIITSIDEDLDEKFRASWAYEASEAAGCGMSLTLIPVSLVNRATSCRSRLWLGPTPASPTKANDFSPYFSLFSPAVG